MQVNQIQTGASPLTPPKTKDVSTPSASSPQSQVQAQAVADLTQSNQAAAFSQLPDLTESSIFNSASAQQTLSETTGSFLGDSSTALAAQANLNPDTVLQLLAD